MLYCGQGIASGNEVPVAAGCIFVPASHAIADIIAIALNGTEPVCNLASGTMVSHGEVANALRNCGFNVTFAAYGSDDIQPALPVARLSALLDWSPRYLLDDLPAPMDAAHPDAGSGEAGRPSREKMRPDKSS